MSLTSRTRTSGRTQTGTSTSCQDPPLIEENDPSQPPVLTQRVWVLVGVVGSGKSTLADAICSQVPNWTRVCQDDLGNRRKCEKTTLEALSERKHVVVDRQNYDVSQRRVWLDLARSAGEHITVSALVFTTPDHECRRRLEARTGHPTVDTPAKALGLLDRFSAIYEDVSPSEGFDQIVPLPADLPETLDVAYVLRLIAQVDRAPRLPKPNPWSLAGEPNQPPHRSGRGRGHGGSRGGSGRGWTRGGSSNSGRGSFRGRGSAAGRGSSSSPRGGSGNRFNGSGNPARSESSLDGWARLGSGTTLSSSSTSGAAHGQEAPSGASTSDSTSVRAQLAQAAEARRRRAEQAAHESTRRGDASATVQPPQQSSGHLSTEGQPPPGGAKRKVIDLSDE